MFLGGDMLKRTDDLKGLDVEFTLEPSERGILASSVKQQGFDLLQKLMEDQVRKFNLKLINTNPADSDMVLANHYLAKAVAQFYAGLMERIEQECQIDSYNNRNKSIVENDMTIPELA
jgi:hypothetical protein